MPVKDAQVRKLMEEHSKHGKVGLASIKAGMDRKTGRKYIRSGKLPSSEVHEREYRTRPDPFEDDWPELRAMFEQAPELEAKSVFDWLVERAPGKYEPGQLRTLQRRIKQWRATEGPPKEVFFAQEHRPGEAMQTDFTSGNRLSVTIAGAPFDHLLCHPVLPYSNWEWVTACRSESMMALRRGVQEALFQLGHLLRVRDRRHVHRPKAAAERCSRRQTAQAQNTQHQGVVAVELHVVQFAVAEDDMDDQGQEQLGQLEVADTPHMTASRPDTPPQIETIEQDLEEHQAAGRGQGLVGEPEGRNGVDAAMDLCFTGSHERRLPLTGLLLASQPHNPMSGAVFQRFSISQIPRFLQS